MCIPAKKSYPVTSLYKVLQWLSIFLRKNFSMLRRLIESGPYIPQELCLSCFPCTPQALEFLIFLLFFVFLTYLISLRAFTHPAPVLLLAFPLQVSLNVWSLRRHYYTHGRLTPHHESKLGLPNVLSTTHVLQWKFSICNFKHFFKCICLMYVFPLNCNLHKSSVQWPCVNTH